MKPKTILIIIIILIIAIVIFKKGKPENQPIATFENETATSEVVVDEITFSNITKSYEEGITTINADVKNNTKTTKDANVEISIYDENKTKVKTMLQILENLQPGEVQKLATGILGNYMDKTYEIEIKFVSDDVIEQYNR